VSLPIERMSVECKLRFGELAVDIINDHAVDERIRRNKEAKKDSVEKVGTRTEEYFTLITLVLVFLAFLFPII
jgi:hypothetical protein